MTIAAPPTLLSSSRDRIRAVTTVQLLSASNISSIIGQTGRFNSAVGQRRQKSNSAIRPSRSPTGPEQPRSISLLTIIHSNLSAQHHRSPGWPAQKAGSSSPLPAGRPSRSSLSSGTGSASPTSSGNCPSGSGNASSGCPYAPPRRNTSRTRATATARSTGCPVHALARRVPSGQKRTLRLMWNDYRGCR